MSSTDNSNGDLLKSIVAGAVAVAADKYILKQSNMQSSLYFGAATAAGIYFSGNVIKMIPSIGSFSTTKTVGTRLAEVGTSSAAVYALNKFVLNNDLNPQQFGMKIAVVVLSDVIGEYASDYNSGRDLSYL